MTDLSALKFFTTPAHNCSYLEDRQATTLFADPNAPITPALYSELSVLGFRRSGEYLYRPHCQKCNACVPARIPAQRFHWTRRHRRVWNRNRDLRVEDGPAEFRSEYYRLYARYICARHSDGDMYPPSEEQFSGFLMSQWSDTRFYRFYAGQDLVAVAVTDVLLNGLSAVYSFYSPEITDRGLGTYAILWQIDKARRLGLEHLYLGYWISNCRKMSYKSSFRPLEVLTRGHWHPLERSAG